MQTIRRLAHTADLILSLRSRTLLSFCLVACLAITRAAEPPSIAQAEPSGVLGSGAAWATPWYIVEGKEDGPTVVVTGGVHGNEPAGSLAAKQLLHWPIQRGKLVVVPQANRLGLAANMRWFPLNRNDKVTRDLNRQFPTSEHESPRTDLSKAIWDLVLQHEPDYLIDLHEGFDFHITNPKSVGSSVVYSKSSARDAIAQSMLDVVNRSVSDERRQFVSLSKSGAASGSLVRACTEKLGIDAFILETTFKDQPRSLRTRQHRMLVSTFLKQIDMIDEDCADRLGPTDRSGSVRVALYDDAGASSNGVNNCSKTLSAASDITFSYVGAADMRGDVLEQFDVVLFPGGSGSKQGKAIGESGREIVREFAREGGGIVGVCAGAYLCSAHYDWSLHVINTAVFNKTVEIAGIGRKSMWYRGDAQNVRMEFSNDARDVFNRAGEVEVRYQNGPIVSRGEDTQLPETTTLAWFRSEVTRYEPQRGTMIDTPAILCADFGNGRVISISPHPEATPGLEPVVTAAIRWSAGVADPAFK
ncbi:MAG: hypothetical protein CMJ64_23450 [Planctomycetaceae bacterium]|nr:hypothetical protein [Planctomycetaceae bacterium]